PDGSEDFLAEFLHSGTLRRWTIRSRGAVGPLPAREGECFRQWACPPVPVTRVKRPVPRARHSCRVCIGYSHTVRSEAVVQLLPAPSTGPEKSTGRQRRRALPPPRMLPSTPRMISRPTVDPIERAALLATVSRTESLRPDPRNRPPATSPSQPPPDAAGGGAAVVPPRGASSIVRPAGA